MAPPVDADRSRPTPAGRQSGSYPSVLEYRVLDGLPLPVQVAVTAAMLPYEAAVTSVRLLKVTEELLSELLFHLNALRPMVTTMTQSYAEGHFDPVLRTLNQLQQGTEAMAFAWAPLNTVREVVIPTQARRPAALPPPARPVITPVPAQPQAPTMSEWIGGFGGRAWGHAVGLPGLVARQLRTEPSARDLAPVIGPIGQPRWDTEPEPVLEGAIGGQPGEQDTSAGQFAALAALQPMFDRAKPLVPGPVRRLFGG